MYNLMDHGTSSLSESVNSRIKRTFPLMRFLAGECFITYLSLRFAIINIVTYTDELSMYKT